MQYNMKIKCSIVRGYRYQVWVTHHKKEIVSYDATTGVNPDTFIDNSKECNKRRFNAVLSDFKNACWGAYRHYMKDYG